jgi:hypothetical protein
MNDTQFWKGELFRERARIRERIEEEGAERLAQHSVLIERFVFVTAYMMRKLTEAVALTEEVKTSKWPVSEFPCTQPPPHRTWFRISKDGKTWRQPLEAHYDLNAPRSRALPFRRLCHYLIHHFAFEVRLRLPTPPAATRARSRARCSDSRSRPPTSRRLGRRRSGEGSAPVNHTNRRSHSIRVEMASRREFGCRVPRTGAARAVTAAGLSAAVPLVREAVGQVHERPVVVEYSNRDATSPAALTLTWRHADAVRVASVIALEFCPRAPTYATPSPPSSK